MSAILWFLMHSQHMPKHRAVPVARKLAVVCADLAKAEATDDYALLDNAGDRGVAVLRANSLDLQLDEVCE